MKRSTIFPNRGYSCAKRVLVVEDDLCLKMVLARFFALLDPMILLTWATSAEEAEEEIAIEKFDVVLADHFLSGRKTGFDLWRRCRERCPKTHFVLMSSSASLQLGPPGPAGPPFLRKPFSIADCQKFLLRRLSAERT